MTTSHRLADEAHAFMGQPRTERNAHRAAADALEEGQDRRRLPPGRDDVCAGDDVKHTLALARLGDVDLYDLGVRAVGAQKVRGDLPVQIMIVGVTALTGNEPLVFPAAPELMLCQCRIPNWFSDEDGRIATIQPSSPSFRGPIARRRRSLLCRPREGGDPSRNNFDWRVWVPAFAGATVICVAPSCAPYLPDIGGLLAAFFAEAFQFSPLDRCVKRHAGRRALREIYKSPLGKRNLMRGS